MKTKFRPKSLWNTFTYALFILLYITDCIQCRPASTKGNGTRPTQSAQDPGINESPQRFNASNTDGNASKVKRSLEFRTEDGIEIGSTKVNLQEIDRKPEIWDVEKPNIMHHKWMNEVLAENYNQGDDYLVIDGRNLVEVGDGIDYDDVALSDDDAENTVRLLKDDDPSSGPQHQKRRHAVIYEDETSFVAASGKLSASRLTPADSMHSSSRNLSRKRRQRSSPVVDDDHQSRRRRRRRKRRHRLLLKAKDRNHVDSPEHRFLLKSDSPSHVITNAGVIKKDWCRTVPLRQTITEDNCRSKVIMNNFCYGQCNSFFIPRPGRTADNSGASNNMNNWVAFQACPFCKPHRYKFVDVTLHCPGQTPPKLIKRVLVVESCRCTSEVLQSLTGGN